ncbi:MAG: DUF2937 family protein [Pseudomonadota bacterium]
MLRLLTLTFGLVSGLSVAQFPEFSQQYLQRLSGAVDALEEVIADFDRSASAAGLSREEALEELQGTVFLDRRQIDMGATIARHARLAEERERLKTSSALERLIATPRAADREIAERAWADYKAAVPATSEGVAFGAAGFLAGALVFRFLWSLLTFPFRRRRHA